MNGGQWVAAGVLLTLFLALAALWWALIKDIQANRERLMRVEQTLYGENGENGLKGDMKEMRRIKHDHANTLTQVLGRVHFLELKAGIEPWDRP